VVAACNPDHPELRYPDVLLQFMKDERSSWFVLNLLVVGSTDLHDWMIRDATFRDFNFVEFEIPKLC